MPQHKSNVCPLSVKNETPNVIHTNENEYEDDGREEEEEEEYTEEEEAALLAGLPPGEMSRLEQLAFPNIVDDEGEERYVNIRNFILVKWLKNTGRNLRVSKAITGLKRSVTSDARKIFHFLQDFGYINFGFCQKLPKRPSRKERIVIIGAGTAGIAAARQLRLHGFDVIVLEARNRIGGRVYTEECLGGPIDLGAMVVTGLEGNPLRTIAEQTGTEFHPIREDCVLFDSDGSRVPQHTDQHIENLFNAFLDNVSKTRTQFRSLGAALRNHTNAHLFESNQPETDQRLFGWHLANLEYGCATHLDAVSLQHWDQDDEWELGGDHCLLPQGYQELLSKLSEDIDIRLQCAVDNISYSGDGVEVQGTTCTPSCSSQQDEWIIKDETGRYSVQADAVLITVPLGVLKSSSIQFTPPLPSWKSSAIQRMGYGLLNKVALRFPECFWLKDDFFGYVNPDFDSRGEFYLFWNMHNCMGEPILMALVAGTAAHRIEKESKEEVELKIMGVLTKIFGRDIPQPNGCYVTRWKSDPWSRGSYSYISVDGEGQDYDLLARNIDNRVFFAGEATCREHPATVAGAFLSGLREAGFISRTFPAQRGRKRPYPSSQDWTLGNHTKEFSDPEKPPSKCPRVCSPTQSEVKKVKSELDSNPINTKITQEPMSPPQDHNNVHLVAPKAKTTSFPPSTPIPPVTETCEPSVIYYTVPYGYSPYPSTPFTYSIPPTPPPESVPLPPLPPPSLPTSPQLPYYPPGTYYSYYPSTEFPYYSSPPAYPSHPYSYPYQY